MLRLLLPVLIISNLTFAQTRPGSGVQRPKLVVGVVVDQMRWDFLYRYYDRYAADGGFSRFLKKGFSCENTYINYTPTVTACGHTSLYTGTVPAVHGIAGNEWYDTRSRAVRYCTSDSLVKGVGTNAAAGQMSPRNMLVTTICDELKLATNFRSKVVGIAFKDRGGILPAGHSADAAYWYEAASGNWITSTYYMNALPSWVTAFNEKKLPDGFYKQGWKTLYPINTYAQSTGDEQSYEGKPFGAENKAFPYNLEAFIGKNYGALANTPYGNTLTKEMALATIKGEQLGKDSVTDFLAVSFSTPDYIGHTFGPNSIEIEDTYLRLDRDLGELFAYLDAQVGKDQYLVFLSADHGVAHVSGFAKQRKLPGNTLSYGAIEKRLDSSLKKQFGNHHFIEAFENGQLFLNHTLIDSLRLVGSNIAASAVNILSKEEGVYRAFESRNVLTVPMPETLRNQVANGHYPGRSGDIQILLKSGWMGGGPTGTTHGAWNPYDSHIPLLWYGWNVKPGRSNRNVHMTDAAPTLAAMLKIQMPSGCIGTVIEEVFK